MTTLWTRERATPGWWMEGNHRQRYHLNLILEYTELKDEDAFQYEDSMQRRVRDKRKLLPGDIDSL